MNKRIIIVGAAGSGKDYLKQKFIDRGFKPEISYTTRPIRSGEKNGINYHFITDDEFLTMIGNDKMVEYVKFNGWFYGTTIEQWENSNIFIKTPSGINQINEKDRKSCFIIYLDIPADVRHSRLQQRNDNNDSITRRMEADSNDFSGFINFDLKITNPNF